MLVLSHMLDDKTFINLEDGRVITIVITKLDNRRVKIGFDAPKSIMIVRENAVIKERKM